jgi:hypothetical protein
MRFLLVLTACGFAARVSGEDGRADLYFPKTDLLDVMSYYENIEKKPIFVSWQVSAIITIKQDNVAVKDIPEVIRKALLERYGIAMRETKEGEVLVEWSTDPKYPRRSEPPRTGAELKALPRARPIRPEGIPIPDKQSAAGPHTFSTTDTTKTSK